MPNRHTTLHQTIYNAVHSMLTIIMNLVCGFILLSVRFAEVENADDMSCMSSMDQYLTSYASTEKPRPSSQMRLMWSVPIPVTWTLPTFSGTATVQEKEASNTV